MCIIPEMLSAAFSCFVLAGLQLLAEALPPEENLGAGETADEWGGGEVVIYPVETIRSVPPPRRPPALRPSAAAPTASVHPSAAGSEEAWISLSAARI